MPLPESAITGTVKQRNARFKKSPPRGDIRYSSRGAGVVYTPHKVSPRKYWLMRVDHQAKVRNTCDHAPASVLIRNGVVIG